MSKCCIACVEYINTLPLIQGLDQIKTIALKPTTPAQIADLVLKGQADIGLVSLVDIARHHNQLTPLPVGMIGSMGPTLTVRLFSSTPLDQITQIACDQESHTSVILCQLLLKKMYGITPQITPLNASDLGKGTPWPQTLLLIGDKVVTNAPSESCYTHQLDLGQAWTSNTDLPFVYAMWACRSDRLDDPTIQNACTVLDHQRRHNATRRSWIASTHAQAHNWPVNLAQQYLCQLLRYDANDLARAGAQRFITEASELGLLAHAPDVFAECCATGC